jgi:hypothetical protein
MNTAYCPSATTARRCVQKPVSWARKAARHGDAYWAVSGRSLRVRVSGQVCLTLIGRHDVTPAHPWNSGPFQLVPDSHSRTTPSHSVWLPDFGMNARGVYRGTTRGQCATHWTSKHLNEKGEVQFLSHGSGRWNQRSVLSFQPGSS